MSDKLDNELFSSRHVEGGKFQGSCGGAGFSIAWAGTSEVGAKVVDVVRATIDRLEFEQSKKELASNDNAKALSSLILARNQLHGLETEDLDGNPIID